MSFNRRLTNYYSEDELKKLLSNPSQYRSIILNKFSRKDKDCKLHDLSIIDALDNLEKEEKIEEVKEEE